MLHIVHANSMVTRLHSMRIPLGSTYLEMFKNGMRAGPREQGGEKIVLEISVGQTTTDNITRQFVKISLQFSKTNLALSSNTRLQLLQFKNELIVLSIFLSGLATEDGDQHHEYDNCNNNDYSKDWYEIVENFQLCLVLNPDGAHTLNKVANGNRYHERLRGW